MRRTLLALTLVFFGQTLLAAESEPSTQIPPGNGPWVVRAYFVDKAQLNRLTRRTAPWEVHHDQGFAVVEVANRFEYSQLISGGFRVSVDSALSQALTSPSRSFSSVPGFACYRTVEETYSSMDAVVAGHPNLATVVDIGDSWNKLHRSGTGYDLRVLKLSNQSIVGDKPRVFIMGAIHAREYATAELVVRYGESLIQRYATDADVRWMLDHHEIYLLPQANPDGRKKAELGQFWRKNVNESYCGTTSSARGADLNRNFPFEWGEHNGSSDEPCDGIFRGIAPASEPESRAIVNYLRTLFTDVRPNDETTPAPVQTSGVFIDLHSYGNLVMWPWGFTESPAPNAAGLATLGRRLAYLNGYYPEQAVSLYVTDGGTKDYVYGDLGIPAMSLELGNAFFENCTDFENTVLPDNIQALDYLVRVARRPYLEPSGPSIASMLTSPIEVGEAISVATLISDTPFSQVNGIESTHNIVIAEAYLDQLPWAPLSQPAGQVMALDGQLNSPSEWVSVDVPAAHLGVGRYSLYLRGGDSASTGPVTARYVDVVAPGSTSRVTGTVRNSVSLAPIGVPAIVELGVYGTASKPLQSSIYALRAPSGSYALSVSAAGYAPKTVQSLALTAPNSVNLNIDLDPICVQFEDDAQSLTQFQPDLTWAPASNRFISAPSAFSESPNGNYPNNANLSLTSITLDFSQSQALSLSFQSFCDTEAGWDFGRVEWSTDGTQWSEIWQCSADASWKLVQLPLPQVEGALSAQIRFRFTSDGINVRDGWSVDDVRIHGTGGSCGLPTLLHADGFE